jgi:hypothetical protein
VRRNPKEKEKQPDRINLGKGTFLLCATLFTALSIGIIFF